MESDRSKDTVPPLWVEATCKLYYSMLFKVENEVHKNIKRDEKLLYILYILRDGNYFQS